LIRNAVKRAYLVGLGLAVLLVEFDTVVLVVVDGCAFEFAAVFVVVVVVVVVVAVFAALEVDIVFVVDAVLLADVLFTLTLVLFALLLLAALSPQVAPSAPIARTAESAITFFITVKTPIFLKVALVGRIFSRLRRPFAENSFFFAANDKV